jgi:hypothetical protein
MNQWFLVQDWIVKEDRLVIIRILHYLWLEKLKYQQHQQHFPFLPHGRLISKVISVDRFLSILSYQTTVTEHLHFIIDTYVKSREIPEHQYWPDQSRPIWEKICIGRLCPHIGQVVLSVSQRQFLPHGRLISKVISVDETSLKKIDVHYE